MPKRRDATVAAAHVHFFATLLTRRPCRPNNRRRYSCAALHRVRMEVLYPQSELIECVAYNVHRRSMRITFKSGRMVDFNELPDSTYRAFARSSRPDEFFRHRIRGSFTWHEVRRADRV